MADTSRNHPGELRMLATIYEDDGVIVATTAPERLRAAADEIERLREQARRDRNVINLIRSELLVDDDVADTDLPALIADLIGLDEDEDDG